MRNNFQPIRIIRINGEMNLTKEERQGLIFFKKRPLTSKGVRNTKENIITGQVLKSIDVLEKLLIVQQGKTIVSVGMHRIRALCKRMQKQEE